jgi:hypothetical protein
VLLLHVPPPLASVTVEVSPSHAVSVPAITAGFALTVIGKVALHVVGSMYHIFTVPAAAPVIVPSVPAVAMALLLLLHVPPVVLSLSIVVADGQVVPEPVIAAGAGFTVSALLAVQPFGDKYIIFAVPAPVAVTKPVTPTVATPVLSLIHVPPLVASVNVKVALWHIGVTPLTAATEFTVTAVTLRQPVNV